MPAVLSVKKFSGLSTANAIGTASTDLGVKWRILQVTVKYSAAPTYAAGVTVILNSGVGAAYDTVLSTGLANAQSHVYSPDGGIIVDRDDQIDVSAPAGGGVITSQIVIYAERLL